MPADEYYVLNCYLNGWKCHPTWHIANTPPLCLLQKYTVAWKSAVRSQERRRVESPRRSDPLLSLYSGKKQGQHLVLNAVNRLGLTHGDVTPPRQNTNKTTFSSLLQRRLCSNSGYNKNTKYRGREQSTSKVFVFTTRPERFLNHHAFKKRPRNKLLMQIYFTLVWFPFLAGLQTLPPQTQFTKLKILFVRKERSNWIKHGGGSAWINLA